MRDTPIPDGQRELRQLRMADALQRARRALVVRPAPGAFELARGGLFPLLTSLGVDVFDLERLRLSNRGSVGRVNFSLRLASELHSIEITALSDTPPLPELEAEGILAISTNLREWRGLLAGTSHILEFELFDDGFAEALQALFDAAEDPESRLRRAQEVLRQARLMEPPAVPAAGQAYSSSTPERIGTSAPDPESGFEVGRATREASAGGGGEAPKHPLQPIDLPEVRQHSLPVRNLHGKLEVWFDGQPIEVTSRSGFYYLLAALALDNGREDAIPGADLVRPPDRPPEESRIRPLGHPGWHLLLDQEPDVIEQRTSLLLDRLHLRSRFSATQRGKPYPADG